MFRTASIMFMLFAALACTEAPLEQTEAIRGLRTFQVKDQTQSMERRYPSVIQPHNETRLAFEVDGQLQDIKLVEGQAVGLGDVLLKLDPSTFELHVQEAEANVAQSTAAHRNASASFVRQSELWDKRVISRSVFDDAEAAVDTAFAQRQQANKKLDIAKDSLAKTELRAPFAGIITNVDVDSFATVSAGQRTLTLYAENALETSFTVPSSVINFLSVGQVVRVVVSDLTSAEYSGRITELGTRASEISAFPIVVVLDDAPERIKAGMSAEVFIDVALPDSGEGFMIPVTCFAFKKIKQLKADGTGVPVFVYDPSTATVHERKVDVIGIRENGVIVQAGLQAGDLVASAGVSYLRDGQHVQLLDSQLLDTL
ncbi:efflux RND transporter periplasmic adaptor subunit [Dasania marina]|uniref:efflux RND transporter periplasmic adaptor subunit n=1 Tax=Dasania marina TaxID=471499 RepID=UPI0030DB59D2|tara:strand:+ start:8825 stop:9937 length:1113 start_codon:yes stop_codon:yes gene_type:complete